MSMYEDIQAGKYENKLPYSATETEKTLVASEMDSLNVFIELNDPLRLCRTSRIVHQRRQAYIAEAVRLEALFKSDALKELGLTDHPKADLLYRISYDRGHSSGYGEIWNELLELSELVR